MSTNNTTILVAKTEVNAPIEKVWELWTAPKHIMQWNNLSDDWHNTKIENDLRVGGRFLFAMGLKNGSFSFDFCGTYDEVKTNQLIAYTLDDGRKSTITFMAGPAVMVTENFEANQTDTVEMQQQFCQAVLNRFKKYAESTDNG
jgi:uncharacterized protein YndB with AHSA1/START domain